MTIERFAAAVPAYLGFYQDRSPHTQRFKERVLRFFVEYMTGEHPGQEIVPEMVLGFRQSLYGSSPNTIVQYMKQVRSAFAFMLDAGMLEGENPVRCAYVGSEKYRPYDALLTQEDIQRILRDECPETMEGRTYLRNRAMTLLCLSSGLRLAELLALMPEDLDWVGEKAVVQHGKGDKRRLVPFHPIAQEAVRKYLKSDQDRVPGLPIFLSKGGRPMSDRTAEYGIGSYLEAVTGRTDISPHGLRHSAASWWVSCGVPMREIQVLLGHASIRTTERYAALVAPDIAPIRSANAVMTLAFGPPGPEAQTCAV